MKHLLPVLCLLSSGFCAAAFATELTDLGSGLGYLRVHSLAESEGALRKVVPGTAALVIDLRYATADETTAAALPGWLAAHPAGTPLLVLVSPATPAAVARGLGAVLTLGAPGSVPAPKVVVQTDATADRQAYDAAEAGMALSLLVSGKIEKERFDEATLVSEFKHGNPGAEPPPAPDPTAPKPAGATEPAKPEKPVDRVLQRAMHLHRALLALPAR